MGTQTVLSHLWAGGFKSLNDEQRLELGRLTVLAGANSSGKSSLLQPLLLLKQTVEAPFDPGPLKLDGPNVEFSAPDQMFSTGFGRLPAAFFSCGVQFSDEEAVGFEFSANGLRMELRTVGHKLPGEQRFDRLSPIEASEKIHERLLHRGVPHQATVKARRERCFLLVDVATHERRWTETFGQDRVERFLRQILHVPGVRGNRRRAYLAAEVQGAMPGVFTDYAASLLSRWTEEKSIRLDSLSKALRELGLGWKVQGTRKDASTVEVFVSRTIEPRQGGAQDLVNVADTGFAVSQSLPVLVALVAAEPGQLVYIEQPEVHLHPRAQARMAGVLVEAVKRGVQVVVETHSNLLLTGLRRLVADQELEPEAIRLHWFSRDRAGHTTIDSANVDASGGFGDWPVDFADVELSEDSSYNDAAFRALGRK